MRLCLCGSLVEGFVVSLLAPAVPAVSPGHCQIVARDLKREIFLILNCKFTVMKLEVGVL